MNFLHWEQPSRREASCFKYIQGRKAVYYIKDGRFGEFHEIRYQLHVLEHSEISLETDWYLHLELFNLEDRIAIRIKVHYHSDNKQIIMQGDNANFKWILRNIFDACDNFILSEVNNYEKLVEYFIIFHAVLIQDTNSNVFKKVCNLVSDLDRKGLKEKLQRCPTQK